MDTVYRLPGNHSLVVIICQVTQYNQILSPAITDTSIPAIPTCTLLLPAHHHPSKVVLPMVNLLATHPSHTIHLRTMLHTIQLRLLLQQVPACFQPLNPTQVSVQYLRALPSPSFPLINCSPGNEIQRV